MYCTYLTRYSGTRLPPFYIGSTSLERLSRGYRGSASSKEYREIWKRCLVEEPELFSTEVLKVFDTRKEAFEEECKLQEELDAIASPLYINKSYARKGGYFGVPKRGPENHSFGKVTSPEVAAKISAALVGRKKSEATKQKMRLARKLRKDMSEVARENIRLAGERRRGINHAYFGKKRSEEVGRKIAASKSGKYWWTDGASNKFCEAAPAPNWQPGMAKRTGKKTRTETHLSTR